MTPTHSHRSADPDLQLRAAQVALRAAERALRHAMQGDLRRMGEDRLRSLVLRREEAVRRVEAERRRVLDIPPRPKEYF